MSEINRWSYELQDIIINKKLNNLVVNSCIECDNDECELKLTIHDNHKIRILSNFKNYCYIESSLYDIDDLNQYILHSNKYKSLESVINAVIEFKYENTNIKKKIKYTDKYHFYNKLDERTKYKLDFKELEAITKNNKIENSSLNIKIPKELLLNNNQIYQLIVTEIKKINSNFDYKHIIHPINNNIYSLNVIMFVQNININIKINLNSKLYPFYPPEIELISPKVKLPLYFAIINLNITKIKNWNSALSLEWIITNLASKLNPLINDYVDESLSFNELEHLLLKLSNITKEQYSEKLSIDFDIQNISVMQNENKSQTWKSGTGYGSNSNENNWNINNYVKEKEVIQIETCKILKSINSLLNEENFHFIKDSCLLRYITNITKGINLLEIEKEYITFNEIIKTLSNIKLFNTFNDVINLTFINDLIKNLQSTNDEIMMLFQNNEELQNNELYQGLHNIYQTYCELIPTINSTINPIISDISGNINNISGQELYCNVMTPLQFGINEEITNHSFYNERQTKPQPTAMKRIISEISSFKSSLPLNYESSIWIRISKTHMNLFSFLISGPKDTPYENGLFLFNAYLPPNYPQVEPKVLIATTGNGAVRFNPNLYACGKVCLSLLGTWSGHESEKWNPKTSTFLQVLVSIQSLILIDNPYFNEPGYEKIMNTPQGDAKSKKYNSNIQSENIRWAMIDQIQNPPKGYEEVVKQHFKIKKNDIITLVDKWASSSSTIKSAESSSIKSAESSSIKSEDIIKLKELLNNL